MEKTSLILGVIVALLLHQSNAQGEVLANADHALLNSTGLPSLVSGNSTATPVAGNSTLPQPMPTSNSTASPVPTNVTSAPVPANVSSSPVPSNVTSAPVPFNVTSAPVASNITSPTEGSNHTAAPVNGTAAPVHPKSAPLKVVCYYNKLAENRSDAVKYSPAEVDSSLCTHVIYSFVTLDPITLTIQNDSLGLEAEKILALKGKGVTVMLSLGGRNDHSESEKFSKMVNDGSNRGKFVDSVVHFLRENKFQGLDVNWEYPSCWNGYCKAGRPADKTNFVNLLKELHSAFRFYKLVLSVAVSPLESVDDKAYDVRGIASNVDFINLMTFDYNNETYATTAIHAPFQGPLPNVVSTVDYWKSKGASAHQLVLGIPTFGRTFTLEKADWNGPKSSSTIGKPTALGQPGLAAYFEVCKGLNYQMKEHEGPYAFKDDQWVSFDDIPSVTSKGAYIKKNELGGAMIWSLDTDDFNGVACEQGKYPLIKAVRSSMGLA